MTYKEIQEIYLVNYGRTIKPCWIADVKRQMGMEVRIAYNRVNENEIQNKCPENIIPQIAEILAE